MVDCINRAVDSIDEMQKIFEERLTHVDANYNKIQATLKTIMTNIHNIFKQIVDAMNTMANNLDRGCLW